MKILKKAALGIVGGGIMGLMELWFFKFDLNHLIAAIVTGAFFFAVFGIFHENFRHSILRLYTLSIILGSVSGMIWWVIAQPDTAIIISIILGGIFGLLIHFMPL